MAAIAVSPILPPCVRQSPATARHKARGNRQYALATPARSRPVRVRVVQVRHQPLSTFTARTCHALGATDPPPTTSAPVYHGLSGVTTRFAQNRTLSRKANRIRGFQNRQLTRFANPGRKSPTFSDRNPRSVSHPRAVFRRQTLLAYVLSKSCGDSLRAAARGFTPLALSVGYLTRKFSACDSVNFATLALRCSRGRR
jgi:hypothetical protein